MKTQTSPHTDRAAADASSALEHLLTALPADKTQLAKDVRAMIDRIDTEFKLCTICLEVELE